VLVVTPRETSLVEALCESRALLGVAADREAPAAGAWLFASGRSIVLGQMQHAGRILSEHQPKGWSVLRRATSGTAVALDGGLLLSIALPSIDAVFRDATPRTVLNRNLRLFLAGLRHASVPVAYFGREHLSWQRRPIAVCGLEMEPSGALLTEVFFTARGDLAIPRGLTTDVERSVDRYGGKATASLGEAAPTKTLLEIAELALEGIVERVGTDRLELQTTAARSAEVEVASAASPLPPRARALPPRAVPIGWLDRAETPAGIWVGGDVLAPSYLLGLGRFGPEHAISGGVPMEGASWEDVKRARDPSP